MKITNEIVETLNTKLEKLGCNFCYEMMKTNDYVPTIRRTIKDTIGFVDSAMINCTDKFYDWLNAFFAEYGIKLQYNNTREICWSNDYSMS